MTSTFDEEKHFLSLRIHEHEYQHAFRRVMQIDHPDWFEGEVLKPDSAKEFVDEMVLRMGGIKRMAQIRTARE